MSEYIHKSHNVSVLISSYEPPSAGRCGGWWLAFWPLEEGLRRGGEAIERFAEAGGAETPVRAQKTGPYRPYAA